MLDWLAANWTEVLGFGTGVLCVWLAARRHVANFPLGLANNVVFLVLFVSTGLYASAGLQVVYGALALHGWFRWTTRDEREAEYIARTPRRHVPYLVGAGVALAALLTVVLTRWTDSTVALADASITAASLVAQYLLNRKRIENWWVWMAVDVAFVVLTASQGLYVTSLLYVIFLVICVYGYRSWLAIERDARA